MELFTLLVDGVVVSVVAAVVIAVALEFDTIAPTPRLLLPL